jgi:hypothetical protein
VVGYGVGALVLVWWDTIDIGKAQLDAEGTTVLLFLFLLDTSVFFSAKAQWWLSC